MSATKTSKPTALADSSAILKRVTDLKQIRATHFEQIRLLGQYSRQSPQSWFPDSDVSLTSVVKSNIRAAEKTAIAMLAGGDPTFRVSYSADQVGLPNEGAGTQRTGPNAANGEKIARAIFHMIDRQSEIDLLYEPVMRAIRQGEVLFQYGWLGAEDRGATNGKKSDQTGTSATTGTSNSQGNLSSVATTEPTGASGNAVDSGATGNVGQGNGPGVPARFPLFIRVHDKLKVFYELGPFGDALEVYHEYTTTASQAYAEFPDWPLGEDTAPETRVRVVDAWVGAYHSVTIDDAVVIDAVPHGYGDYPPFVIERCAVEDVAEDAGEEGSVAVMAGMPFAYDMMTAFKEASIASSLKRAILEHSAIGAWWIKNASTQRQTRSENGAPGATIKLGPGTLTIPYPGEEIIPFAVAPLPPAVESYLTEAESEMAALSFSPALLKGEMPGDPSGYSIEQVRQAAMARLNPYKSSISRAFSRLWEKLFYVLAQNWAPEWGESLVVQGTQKGSVFSMAVTPEMLDPAPDHVEVELIPMLPQNKIAMRQSLGMQVQQGTKDILTAMAEDDIPDPQLEYDNMIIHKFQMSNPQAMGVAAQAILQQRSGQPAPPPGGAQPTGNIVAQPPPGATIVGPDPAPTPTLPGMPDKPGPSPMPTPASRPQGMLGSPNPPMPTVPAPNQGPPPSLRR